ncbi:pyruvate kinase [Terasakiella sp. A23]|uniref:pyruvate kinase n=1 Tax=Terasakiella sp. FCG-A23 TaxID=3080561 RepID=UPI002954F0A9|nr:pyruvate kinase [Terasakiella sp. A23]MDV7341762.1 pyruvate kinase [Terasakiella sp. A23]
MSHNKRKAKIVATLGPSSATREDIRKLVDAGANVFRLNFSHGEVADHQERLEAVRAIEDETGHPIGLFMDLQGPKFRIGTFQKGEVRLEKGDEFVFDLLAAGGDENRVCLPHPEIFEALQAGDRLLLNDGRMVFKVVSVSPTEIQTVTLVGGTLSDRKGVNLPDAEIQVSALTEKDRKDLEIGLAMGITSVALSFVQRPEDLLELRELVGPRVQIIAKIEKPTALNRLTEIVEQTDAVMVARGDLGVELPPEKVPPIQKKILSTARNLGRPVIVATQMLETMIDAPVPTRAEASDVASAIYDGADAVMLSAETAAGSYPVEAVSMMSRVITEVERDPLYRSLMEASRNLSENTNTDAISAAARQVAATMQAASVICYSTSGKTAMRAARERPKVPISALTSDIHVARSLCLVWGVRSIICADAPDMREMVKTALNVTLNKGIVKQGETVVITAGVPFGNAGTTNILRIAEVGGIS